MILIFSLQMQGGEDQVSNFVELYVVLIPT
jgi:hypothetical protein